MQTKIESTGTMHTIGSVCTFTFDILCNLMPLIVLFGLLAALFYLP